jgi:quinol monooxygenase YgiN
VSEPLVFVDSSEIREGKLEELKKAIDEMVEFIDSNEPRPLSYNVYLSEDETRMTVVQVHPDSASMEVHMNVAAPVFRTFVDLVAMSSMDIYGTPTEALLGQMRQKARMLGLETVVVHEPHAGFVRFGIR